MGKQRRDVSNWQVLGVFLLIASGAAFLVLFAVADAFGIDSEHCLHNGPFPAVEQGGLEGGGVDQRWQWAPMGLRCDWRYPDGAVVTTTTAAWSRNLLGASVVVGAASGVVLTLRRSPSLY